MNIFANEFITVTIPKEKLVLEENDSKVTVHYSQIRFYLFNGQNEAWVNGLVGPLKETPQEIIRAIDHFKKT